MEIKNKIKSLISKKRVWFVIIVIILIAIYMFFGRGPKFDITILDSTYGTLRETVRATGQVTSLTDLNLSFNKQGIVKNVNVHVGDKVKKGQILASLSASSEYAKVVEAQGSLASAKAKLKKIIEGATNEEINLAKVSLDNAKKDLENIKNTQATLVKNAYSNLLNSYPEAVLVGSSTYTAPTITGTYNLGKEGQINLTVNSSGSGAYFAFNGIENGTGILNNSLASPIGSTGLFITFSDLNAVSGTSWTITLPNKKATNYQANLNAYESAQKTQISSVSSAESLVAQREAELALKVAKARNSDIELGEADVLSAEGRLAEANAVYEENIIRAPENGTITKVVIKNGEIANAQAVAIVLQDVDNMYVEADINESNISKLKLNQPVEVSIDALSTDPSGNIQNFGGFISQIDPSNVSTDGVVNYKIKVTLNSQVPEMRPGMNSEITVVVFEKGEVLSVPEASIINREGKNYLDIITDVKKKKYIEKEISIGVKGDGNLTEVLSGLNKEDKIAIVKEIK